MNFLPELDTGNSNGKRIAMINRRGIREGTLRSSICGTINHYGFIYALCPIFLRVFRDGLARLLIAFRIFQRSSLLSRGGLVSQENHVVIFFGWRTPYGALSGG